MSDAHAAMRAFAVYWRLTTPEAAFAPAVSPQTLWQLLPAGQRALWVQVVQAVRAGPGAEDGGRAAPGGGR